MKSKIIIGLIFAYSAITSPAQINSKYITLDKTTKTHFFTLSELQVDSVFINNFNYALFDENNPYMNNIMSNPREKAWRHFHIQFMKKDSANYYIEVSLWDIPARKSIGFFEHNGFFYWFGDDVPSNIVSESKSKKRISYKEPIPAPYDPPFWYLTYNIETGNIKIKEMHCR